MMVSFCGVVNLQDASQVLVQAGIFLCRFACRARAVKLKDCHKGVSIKLERDEMNRCAAAKIDNHHIPHLP